MFFRDPNGELVSLEKLNFVRDKEYYEKLMRIFEPIGKKGYFQKETAKTNRSGMKIRKLIKTDLQL